MAKKNSQKEQKLQTLVSDYINKKYRGTIFFCDVAAGLHLPIWIGALVKRWRSSKGLPDVYIFEPQGEYKALMLELKVSSPLKKDGSVKKDDHLQEQNAIQAALRNKGYAAYFVVGIHHSMAMIDWYMGGAIGDPPRYVEIKPVSLFDG
jgi:hypothetical protein